MEVLGDFLERYTALPLVVIAEHYSQATMAWLFRKGVWELAQRHQVDREWAVDMAREILDLAGATTQDAEPQPARGLATPKMIPAPGRTPDMVGRVLDGRWLLHTLMDEGGMGLVFQATDQDMGRECAVKVVHPKLVSDGRIRDRFMREVLILHAVEHSHIPAMYGSGLDHVTQSPYVVMELLQGRNLRSTLMKFKRLPLGDCLWIAEGALRALGALHKARILHRDVKPENIFLHSSSPESYKAYLLDFGVSRVTDMQMRYQTEPGIVCGTPQYMAPEQQRDQPIDHRVDYYSLGLVLFEMFTGMRCGDGFDPKPLAEDEERLARWREALEGHPSEVAQAATRWLRWLTQRDPAQRPQTSTAALQSLRRLRRLLVKEPADTLSVPDMLKRQD
jgi:serine/threonine-protein kinase